FHGLVERGVENELRKITRREDEIRPQLSAADLRVLHRGFDRQLRLTEEFVAKYKGLIFQIRSEGITVSDRRVIKLTKLFAASALLDGRPAPDEGDFFVLKHIWNNLEQAELLEEIVNPVVEGWRREHPEQSFLGGASAGVDQLLSELTLIRERLTS